MRDMDEQTKERLRAELGAAVGYYRSEKQRAASIERTASDHLADMIREAFGEGMKKADILRAIEHEWSRTWLDQAIKGQ